MTGMTRAMTGIAWATWSLGIIPAEHASGQSAVLDSAAAMVLLRSTCGGDAVRGGLGMLRGEVRDREANPIGAVAVTLAWRRPLETPSGGTLAGAVTDEPALGELSDAEGHWHLCGAPLRTAISARAAADEGSDERVLTLDARHPVASVDFSLRPDGDRPDAVRSPRTSALVVLSVEDRAGNALGGVTVDIEPSRGPPRRAVSDSAGRAIVPAVEPGMARVKSLGIGYRPGELYVPLDAGRNTIPLILDPARTPTLATVRVLGDREVLARHQDFEVRRRLRQTTASITAEDIAKRNPADTWQMLTNVPAMRVIQYGAGVPGVFAASTRERPVMQRRGSPGGASTVPCWYRVMLDGVLLPDAMPDLSTVLPDPADVHGIEVFAGLATLPPQYNGLLSDGQGGARSNACGLIVVWTK